MAAIQTPVVFSERGGRKFLTTVWERGGTYEQRQAEGRHDLFIGQFATPQVRALVARHFAKEIEQHKAAWLARGERYFNGDTLIRQWDQINEAMKQMVGRIHTDSCWAGVPKGTLYWAPANTTSIGKCALHLIINGVSYEEHMAKVDAIIASIEASDPTTTP